MLLRICATILILGLPLSAAPNAKWLLMRSENFDLLTDGGERTGRRMLNYFEQVRAFFLQTLGANLTPLPVRIVHIGDEATYKRYRMSEAAGAFYLSGAGADTIVMGPRTSSDMAVAVHEYVHVLIRHSRLTIPLWLEEGIAEVYSTITPVSGKMQVGAPPLGRVQRLLGSRAMPLDTVFSVGRGSSEYTSRDHAGDFYARSWALAHMMMLDASMRDRFDSYLRSMSDDVESEAAFSTVYALTRPQLEDRLAKYVNMPTIAVAMIPYKTPARFDAIETRPAEPYEYEIALAHIDAALDRAGSAIERCTDLERRFPARPEPSEALAYIHMRNRDVTPAVQSLSAALAKGATSRSALLHYLRMAPDGHAELARAEGAASKLLLANASDLELRLVLARRQLTSKRHTQARATLAQVTSVKKHDAAEFFRLMAYAAIGENDPGEAAIAVRRLKTYLREDQQPEADRLQSAVDALTARAALASSAAPPRDRVHTAFPSRGNPDSPTSGREPLTPSSHQPDPDNGPPVIRYVEPKPEPMPSAEPQSKWRTPDSLPSVEGHFASLECTGARAAMLISTASRTLRLFIDDPLSIEMKNGNGASMEFSCGKQTDLRRVVIQFEPMPAGRSGDGLVRSILFQ